MNKNRKMMMSSLLLLFGQLFSMENKNQSSDNWAVIVSRGCGWCGVKDPTIPRLDIIEFTHEDAITIGSFFRDRTKSQKYCVHSTIGPFRGLNGVSNEKYFNQCAVDNRLYKGPFGTNYRSNLLLENKKIFFKPQQCLFTGSSFLVENGCLNKSIVSQLYKFFSIALHNQFDVFDLITKRWPNSFILDVFCRVNKRSRKKKKIDALLPENCYLGENYLFATSSNGLVAVLGLGSKKDNLMLWDNAYAKQIMPLVGHTDPITHVMFSKNDDVIVSISAGTINNCIVWDVKTGNVIKNIELYGSTVSALAVSDNLIAVITRTNGANKTLSLFSVEDGNFICSIDGDFPDFESIEIASNNRLIIGKVAVAEKNCLLLWKINSNKKELLPLVNYGTICASAYNNQNGLIAIANYDAKLYMLDLYGETEKIVMRSIAHGIVRAIAFSPSDRAIVLATVYDNQTVFLYSNFFQTKDFFLIPSISGICGTDFTSISFNHTGDKMLLGTSNSFVLGEWMP